MPTACHEHLFPTAKEPRILDTAAAGLAFPECYISISNLLILQNQSIAGGRESVTRRLRFE